MPSDTLAEITSLQQELAAPEVHADPYPFYGRLRELGPVCRATVFDGLVVTHHAEATAVLRHPHLSSSARHNEGYPAFRELAEQAGLGRLLDVQDLTMLFADPPDHTRLRRLVSKAFTGRAVEAMRPHIQEIVDDLLDRVEGDDGMDVVAQLAYPLPVTVISEMLGLPAEDRFRFQEWTRAAVRVLDPGDDMSVFFAAHEAFEAFSEYFSSLLPGRRADPGDDLLSALVQAEDEGDRLSHEELLATTILLFVAGHETTLNLIGNGVLALLRHPEQLRRLVDDPSLVVGGVEELLRWDSPVQLTGRVATQDLEVAGVEVRRGQEVVALLGAANHDPAAFEGPEALDVGRVDNRHLSFGGGIHLCLGAPLARVEAQVAIASLLERHPGLRLATDEVRWKETITLRGLAALPVAW